MPNKLRSNVSGTELLKFFESKNFILKRTKGSHMVLVKKLSFGDQVLVIPKHKTVPRGTLNAIYKQAVRFIPESELFGKFYSK
jgi:predicted RNA binding protein YcfA (HicA-like mRNA interferase family)